MKGTLDLQHLGLVARNRAPDRQGACQLRHHVDEGFEHEVAGKTGGLLSAIIMVLFQSTLPEPGTPRSLSDRWT